MEKTVINIVLKYNEKVIHTTVDAVIDKKFADEVKDVCINQIDAMIQKLNYAQKNIPP